MSHLYDPNNIEENIPKSDFSLPKFIGVVAGVSLLTFGITKYFDNSAKDEATGPVVTASSNPEAGPKALERLGIEVIKSFKESGIQGHGILHQGQPLLAYEVPGTDKIIIGDMVSRHGVNLSQAHREDHVLPHIGSRAWPHLEASDYVIDQENTSGPILYTITDPNCPYCLKLWEVLSPFVDAGDIQVRHMIVGILGEDSLRKAAAILEAENSAEILHEYQTARSSGVEYKLPDPSQESIDRVLRNNDLMRKAGASGTPASYTKYPNGHIEYISGAFDASRVNELIKKHKNNK